MMLLLTFLLTTAGWGVLLWLIGRRLTRHLQRNPEAVKAVVDHVVVPLLGPQPRDDQRDPTDNPRASRNSS